MDLVTSPLVAAVIPALSESTTWLAERSHQDQIQECIGGDHSAACWIRQK